MAATGVIGELILQVERTAEGAARQAGRDISKFLTAAKKKDTPVLLLASGGTALGVFGHIRETAIGKFLTLSVLDERYDPKGTTSNARAIANSTFFRMATKKGMKFIDVDQSEEATPDDVAISFEKKLHAWAKRHPDGVIIATAGIGADGHTAGMMPYPESEKQFKEYFESERWICAYDAGGKNPFHLRITATATLLRKIDRVFVIATGEGKAQAISRFAHEGSAAEVPARLLKATRGTFYTDSALYLAFERLTRFHA